MSTPELPDDLRRWPADPYELLGVRPGVSPRDLRRAYTRLIRRYKPEQYPDHFRRIREAYETVLRFAGGGIPFPGDGFPDLPAEPPRPARAPAADGLLPAPPSPEQELREAWERACSGDEEAAYARLRRLEAHHLGNTDVCLRLYWLLSLNPDLDAVRRPCDWLVQGLRASGLAGPLRELYRRELAEDPGEALGERCTRLLEAPAPAGLVVDLLDWRWRAAAKGGELAAVVAADLERFRGRLGWQDEQTWARLLILAVHRLAWDDSGSAAELEQRCKQELEQLTHVHQRLQHELDMLDQLLELSADWHDVRGEPDVPPALLDLIPLSWERPPDTIRPALHKLLADIEAAPQRYLRVFGRIRECGAAVLTQFGQVLADLERGLVLPRETRSAIALTESLLEFVDLGGWRDYPHFRRRLLDYCLREVVSPERVGQALVDRAPYWLSSDRHLSQAVLDDWPLRYVWLACRLFWA
jgi:hypothetical protein